MPPDFNADKEHGQGEVVYAVRNSQRGLPVKTLHTGKGDLQLDRLGRCIIKDHALAAEVRREYGKDLAVSRVFRNHPSDRGHNYVFGQIPEMPWKRQTSELEAQESQEARVEKPEEEEKQEG